MRSFSVITVALLLVASSEALPYGDDNNDIYSNIDYEDSASNDGKDNPDEKEISRVPTFTSEPLREMVNEGGTIRLPCFVDKLEGFVLIWRHGETIVAVGSQVIRDSDKYRLEGGEFGYTLLVSLADEGDAGNYSCQISSFNPSILNHSVSIRIRPEVRPVPSSGILTVKTGESASLGCEVVRGSPAPEVKWHRRERKMPSGEDFIRGLSLTFTSVTRHHSGNYVCSADNGFGDPTDTYVKLDVQHAPEIEQEETFIHTGEGDETEVICVVHSSPKADVSWFKDGKLLDSSSVISHRGNRHMLRIPSVDESNFGEYSCQAHNQFGSDQKATVVSGLAGDVTFTSDPKGPNYDRYQLVWSAQSNTPITRFRVQWRPLADHRGSSGSGPASRNSLWAERELDAVNRERNFYSGDFTIPSLRPATVYLARVSSKNAYGYNEFGSEFKFATKGADPVQKPLNGARSLGAATAASLLLAVALQRLL